MVKEHRIKRRKLKVGRVIFVSIICWLSILGFLSLFNKSEATVNDKIDYKEIIITKGETLWSIAKIEQNNNEYYENKPIQEIIYHIKQINNLNSDIVKENQKILIAKY